MNHIFRWATTTCLAISLTACTGLMQSGEDDLTLDDNGQAADSGASAAADTGAATTAEAAPAAGSTAADDFADFDNKTTGAAPAEPQATGDNPVASAAQSDKKIEDELNIDEPPAAAPPAEQPPAQANAAPAAPAELPPEPLPPQAAPEQAPPPEQAATPPPAEQPPVAAAPVEVPAAPAEAASSAASSLATITNLKFKANDNGGTLVIEANAPVTFTTRVNPDLHQMIVEVPNTVLPRRLQRPLNTRDIQGTIGSIDPYQNAGSNVSRFVLQLRDGSPDPVVQQEGNSILVVANGTAPSVADAGGAAAPGESPRVEAVADAPGGDNKILTNQSVADYLSNNTKFYGKKISIETNNMDIRDALRFIMEESGVNMVVGEEVKGNLSLKLRQVPWDQALVMVMRAKHLGYNRQGSILRIAPLDQLRKEEEDANKLVKDRRTVEPLIVRLFALSYGNTGDLEKKVKDFLSERGKVVGDPRTNSLVVTDTPENVDRIAKLVKSLDTQPQQVLIEGKIVEAREDFTRAIGINWGATGQDVNIGSNKAGPVHMRPSYSINPFDSTAATGKFDLSFGTFDALGDLAATLLLSEKEDKVKILSSPRIVTMSNEKAQMSNTNEVALKQVTQNGTATQTTFTFKPLTLKLEVTPQVTSESSIIMKLNVKREFAGAVQDQASGAFPVFSREADTRVLVRNGQTAVIGGVYQSDIEDSETGVPYLRSIPVVGALFRGRTKQTSKTELLVFVTPRILAAGAGESKTTDTAKAPTESLDL